MKKNYLSEGYTMPEIVVLDIAVEQGFSLSAPSVGEDPEED